VNQLFRQSARIDSMDKSIASAESLLVAEIEDEDA
jgi:hypothetical protein